MTNYTLFCGLALVIIGLNAYLFDAPSDIKEANELIAKENSKIEERNAEAKSKDANAKPEDVQPLKTVKVSVTSAIPAFFGAALLAIFGLVVYKPGLRKHAMHAGAVIGLLGAIGGLYYPLTHLPLNWGQAGTRAGILMTVTCAVYVALAVNSFIEAKKAREAAKPA